DLDVGRGEIFCLVGESGCGKTTTGKGILRLVPPTGGDVFVGVPKNVLDGYDAAKAGRGPADLETIRRQHSLSWKEDRPWTVPHFVLLGIVVAVAGLIATALPAFVSASVFHLPFTNGWSYIGYGLVVGLLVAYFGSIPPTRPTPRTTTVLGGLAVLLFNLSTYLGLVFSGYVDAAGLYQSQVWGDETVAMLGGTLFAFVVGVPRQRLAVAGADVLDPEFLVADEPVSMLDVSIRTEILELLLELREKKGLTYLFITHDLSLAWVLADRIGVMYLGKIVEEGPTRELIKNPRHPYTKALVSVVPVPDPDRRRQRIILKGERPDPSDIPPGCRFHPRCPVAFERCGWTAEEIVDDLKDLATGTPEEGLFAGLHADSPLAFTLPAAPPDAQAAIRRIIEGNAEQSRGLKAIRTIER